MVVSSFIQVWSVEPNVDSYVVLLALFMSILVVFSGAGADNELRSDRTARVAVAGEAEFAALGGGPVVEVDFGGLVEILLVLREVAAADQKQLL